MTRTRPLIEPTRATRADSVIGFPPILGAEQRVLVLGSFPGDRSLAERRYYANPQNRFWRAVAPTTGIEALSPYRRRLAGLRASGIGLWDVLLGCERRGSLDQAIVRGSEYPNDIGALIERHTSIRMILFNGAAAAALFARCILPTDFWSSSGISMRVMPSTSPANAAMPLRRLVEEWTAALHEGLRKRRPSLASHRAAR